MDGLGEAPSHRSLSLESSRSEARSPSSPGGQGLLRTGSADRQEGYSSLSPGRQRLLFLDAEETDGRPADGDDASSTLPLYQKTCYFVVLVALVVAGVVLGRHWDALLRPTESGTRLVDPDQTSSQEIRSTTTASAPITIHKTPRSRKVKTKAPSTVVTTTHPATSITSKKLSSSKANMTRHKTTSAAATTAATTPEVASHAPKFNSEPPVLTFYMYRSQSDENYSPENQDMANLAGVLWYLHNEIVFTSRWHHNKKAEMRSGTMFSVPKTRIERFRVSTRAPKRLYAQGMNFGPLHEFDSGRCTGPGKPGALYPSPDKQCVHDYERYGYTVGCETWNPNAASNYPHAMWNSINHYPGARWYSLPGSCPQEPWKNKSTACKQKNVGGACRNMTELLSEHSPCTYLYEKEGELSIDELEGLKKGGFQDFLNAGGVEYFKFTDRGTNMSFWDFKNESYFCQKRIDHAKRLFAKKYPDSPDLEDPDCNFDWFKFYSTSGDPGSCDEMKCAAHALSFNCSTQLQSWQDIQWQHCCCPKPEVPSVAKCRAHQAELQECRWTTKWRCPGQPGHPTAMLAANDGSFTYECCCDFGFWDPIVRNHTSRHWRKKHN